MGASHHFGKKSYIKERLYDLLEGFKLFYLFIAIIRKINQMQGFFFSVR